MEAKKTEDQIREINELKTTINNLQNKS